MYDHWMSGFYAMICIPDHFLKGIKGVYKFHTSMQFSSHSLKTEPKMPVSAIWRVLAFGYRTQKNVIWMNSGFQVFRLSLYTTSATVWLVVLKKFLIFLKLIDKYSKGKVTLWSTSFWIEVFPCPNISRTL